MINEKKSFLKRVRRKWRRFSAVLKTRKVQFTKKYRLYINNQPLLMLTRKTSLSAGFFLLSMWHFALRCFYYTVILIYRFATWVSQPFANAAKTILPILQKKYQTLIQFKDTFLHSPMGRIPAVALIGAFTALILSINYFGLGLEVFIDGQSVGFATNQQQIDSVIHTVESQSAYYLNHPYNLNIDVEYKLRLMDKTNIINPAELEETLFSKVNEISDLYVLKIDGKIIGANANKSAIELVLNKLLEQYGSKNSNVKTEFIQDVQIEKMPVANIYLRSVSQLTSLLKGGTGSGSTKVYTVQDGDTASGIASKNSLKMSELKALNPDLNPDKLSIGQKINLRTASSASSSLISVKQIKQVSYTENIPYKTQTEKSDNLYKNNKKVVVSGIEGTAKVSAEVVMINGEEVSRKILDRVQISDPINEIVQIGTKKPPVKSATGKFTYPFRGLVTSNYGYRHSEFHTGVDFAGPIGSRIVAADGGKVIFAGWKGNYGNCVIISHGRGLETLYGHCSKLLVTSGQQVGKGEQIARLGSTGRSTGPHVHFEVRINGNFVSPWKYLR
ncbi:MAG: peptidoglycan DD-metalloendopeptidase family protein [Clostridiales bacterium]|nr:peptidoglycan DD-metalloendopeptidase family protein [Clostridiales bacterium]